MRRRRNWPGSLNAISWRIAMEIRILAAREYARTYVTRVPDTVRQPYTRDSDVISFHVTREPNIPLSRLNDFYLARETRMPFRDSRRDPNFCPLGGTRTKFHSSTKRRTVSIELLFIISTYLPLTRSEYFSSSYELEKSIFSFRYFIRNISE